MQVPALVLDCEPNIDFNRDVDAKREYVNFPLFSVNVYKISLSLNSILTKRISSFFVMKI